MKQISSTNKQTTKGTSKTVSLYLPTNSINKQTVVKSQKGGAPKLNQTIVKQSPKSQDVQIDLNMQIKLINTQQHLMTTEPIENEENTINQSNEISTGQDIIHDQLINHKLSKELAVLLQKVEFLETQLKESSNKLLTQEQMYEQLIQAYSNTQEKESLQSLINKCPVLFEKDEQIGDQNLSQKLKNQEVVKEDLENKVSLLERTLEQQATEYRFIIKDQKHQLQEIQMRLKHNENRNIQNQENQFRITEEINEKHQIELDAIQNSKQLEVEVINDKNQQLMESLKELYQAENQNLHQKINELKGQIRMQELQILEYQGQGKDQLSFSMDALETIHLRYLEEIKNLNITLGAFRQEKENETKLLKDQLKQIEIRIIKEENQSKELSQKLVNQKEMYENKILESRKKLDQAFKALADHEKCEITIQGQKKRMLELKYKLEQLEYKDKWTTKTLVNKRSQIEGEKLDLQKKMVTQIKSNKNRLMSQQKQNGTLEKKMVHLNDELETSQRLKDELKGKVQELTKELEIIKCDQLNNSICISQRSIMAKSVSPRQAQAQRFMNGKSKNLLNQTANLSKIIEKIGGGKQKIEISPRIQMSGANETLNKSLFLSINQNIGPSIESSIHPSPSNYNQQGYSRFLMNKSSQLVGGDLTQIYPPVKTAIFNNRDQNNQAKAVEDDMTSFLASPKVEGLSFIQNSTMHGRKESERDSTSKVKQTRSKATSQYDTRCKNCSRVFENIHIFLNHQNVCRHKQFTEKGKYIQLSDHNNSNGSPEIRRNSPYLKTQSFQSNLLGSKTKNTNEVVQNLQKTSSQINLMNTPKQHKSQFFQPVNYNKSRNNEFSNIQSKSNLSQQPTGNFQHKQQEQIIEDPQIMMNKSQACNNIMNKHDYNILRDSAAMTLEESNMNHLCMDTSARQINTSSIFHPSILSQSQNIHNNSLNTTRTNYELEKENDKIMTELKQTKIDLALCQEKSSATELQLKQDIILLQYQMTQLMGGNSQFASQSQPFPSPQGDNYQMQGSFQSHVRQDSTQELFNNNPFNGTNINIQTTNVTCFNIGCSSVQNSNDFAFGQNNTPRQQPMNEKERIKEQTFSNIPPTSTPQKLPKLHIQKVQNDRYNEGMIRRCPSENLDSPSLLYSTVGEETLPSNSNLSNNKQIRINRAPTLLLQKQ